MSIFSFHRNLFSQEKCKDLFVTEIVFAKQVNSDIINHSIELFNPTEQEIDLSTYKIVLDESNGNSTTITLDGLVPPHGTFVISNINADLQISGVTDVFDFLLSLEGKVAVKLTGSTGTVIDKFGQQGVETTATTIDITELLNNPYYIDNLDINLGSIENLLIRRKPTVQKGKNTFQSSDLINEWDIFPNFLVDNLGSHVNACMIPVVSWLGINDIIEEETVFEQNEDLITGVYNVEGLEDVGIEIGVNDLNAVFVGNEDYDVAFSGSDYSFVAQNLFLTPGESNIDFYDLAVIVNDLQPEEDEAVGFWLEVINDNGTFAIVADNVYDVIIIDDDATGIEDHTLKISDLNIFPTVTNSIVYIENINPDLTILDVSILSYNGANVFHTDFDKQSNKVNIQSLPTNGYYNLLIKTNKGIFVKKFIKIK